MRQYEMTYLLSEKVSDNEITATTGKINGIITKHSGKILGEENWGRRKLAYTIAKQDFATYITLNFEIDPNELNKIARDFRLTSEIIRHLIIVKDYGKEELKLSADEIVETEDIEEVVGGEKSFEAIEGETEQSYDLMAKREDDKDTEMDDVSKPDKDADKATEEPAEIEKPEAKEKKITEKTKEETKKIVNTKKGSGEILAKESPKPKKTATKKTKPTEIKEEVETVKPEKKTTKKSVKTEAIDEKKQKAEAEADRLAKLDEEIEGILGDDL